jgi:hypothetical protein
MAEDPNTQRIINMSTVLGGMDEKLDTALKRLDKHEERIDKVESVHLKAVGFASAIGAAISLFGVKIVEFLKV